MITVADTGAMLALLDADDREHEAVARWFRRYRAGWLVPGAVLAEVDYLVAEHLGRRAQKLFLADLATGAFAVEWGTTEDLEAAVRLERKYRGLRLGLVDTMVMAMAQRLAADAIATLDLRHFGAVELGAGVRLVPRDA